MAVLAQLPQAFVVALEAALLAPSWGLAATAQLHQATQTAQAAVVAVALAE